MNMHRTDCYFYNEDYDMGGIISTCGADPNNFVWGKCECSKCKNFLSKADVNKIIREYLKNSREELESNINTTSYIRTIPQEDMLLSSWDNRLLGEFKDGVYCKCGEIIRFKNRKPYETVRVLCPKCRSEILYG